MSALCQERTSPYLGESRRVGTSPVRVAFSPLVETRASDEQGIGTKPRQLGWAARKLGEQIYDLLLPKWFGECAGDVEAPRSRQCRA